MIDSTQASSTIEWMRANTSWNSFAASLIAQLDDRGFLSEKQIAAADRMVAKANSNRPTALGTLSKIREIFANAIESGLKRPRFHLSDIVISLAPPTGKNAGYLYVKEDGEYQGKISESGAFFKIRDAREGIEGDLTILAADPLSAAIEHGKATGSCACCGRELTDEKSVELGIGPICRKRWSI